MEEYITRAQFNALHRMWLRRMPRNNLAVRPWGIHKTTMDVLAAHGYIKSTLAPILGYELTQSTVRLARKCNWSKS